jgi:hypothetical protein
MNDGGILPPSSQHHGRQSLRCGGHDDFGDSRCPREKYVIPLLLQESGGFADCAKNDGKRVAIQTFWN